MTEAEKAYQYFVIAVPENEEQAKAYFWARKALQPTLTPPNEPLSIAQLQEMDGKWITIKAFDKEISGIMPAFIKDQFATTLCELGSKAIVPDLCEAHFSFNEYGKTWIAYRRPPEGES